MEDQGTGPGEPRNRARLLLAAGLAAGLAVAVVLAVVLSGDPPPRDFAEAPPDCIADWNGDPAALAFGRHQSGAHQYYDVQVMLLSPDGGAEISPRESGGACAVVFAASALDPEPISAAQIKRRGAWTGLSEVADFERLTALQQRAQRAYNARVTPEGSLEPL